MEKRWGHEAELSGFGAAELVVSTLAGNARVGQPPDLEFLNAIFSIG